jgi:hypothetical protein
LSQETLAQIPAAMDGYGCAPTVGVLQHNVAPRLPDLLETARGKHAQKLLGGDRRKTRAQTATRTFVVPCSW